MCAHIHVLPARPTQSNQAREREHSRASGERSALFGSRDQLNILTAYLSSWLENGGWTEMGAGGHSTMSDLLVGNFQKLRLSTSYLKYISNGKHTESYLVNVRLVSFAWLGVVVFSPLACTYFCLRRVRVCVDGGKKRLEGLLPSSVKSSDRWQFWERRGFFGGG